jgi:hypothetical protein
MMFFVVLDGPLMDGSEAFRVEECWFDENVNTG